MAGTNAKHKVRGSKRGCDKGEQPVQHPRMILRRHDCDRDERLILLAQAMSRPDRSAILRGVSVILNGTHLRCGSDAFHPHKLGKTFGSRPSYRRLRIEVVSALLGHSHFGISATTRSCLTRRFGARCSRHTRFRNEPGGPLRSPGRAHKKRYSTSLRTPKSGRFGTPGPELLAERLRDHQNHQDGEDVLSRRR